MLSMAARLSRQSTRRNIRNNLGRFLGKSGFRVRGVESAEDFYVALLRERADLVVVLTARGDLSSRITGLESEALQYFVKPTDLNELVAGIRSLLRRPGQAPAALAAMGSWRLRTAEAVLVSPDNKPVALTTRELELMCCLARTPGSVVRKSALIASLGGGDADEAFHRVEAQLNRLRRKTLLETGLPLPVRAVFGRGLVLVP